MSEGDRDGRRATVDLRSFGRRRGRKLSDHQQRLIDELLPHVAVPAAGTIDPLTLFSGCSAGQLHEVWLEIGFGGGEHLIWQARANPDVGLIGCEPFEDGLVKVLSAIERDRIANVRLYNDDARNVLRRVAPASLSRAFVLFPDPWPKKRHAKRRLLSTATLDLIADALRPGAELRVATDIGDYARTILIAVAACGRLEWTARQPADWRVQPTDWPTTRYQQKAMREGRRCYFLAFRRR